MFWFLHLSDVDKSHMYLKVSRELGELPQLQSIAQSNALAIHRGQGQLWRALHTQKTLVEVITAQSIICLLVRC